MSIFVAPARVEHAEVIARFNQAMALETENKSLAWDRILAGVKAMLANPVLGFYLVAQDASEAVVGCLAVTFEWSDWRNGTFWWIQSVYVDPALRGTGVFTQLYREVKALASSADNVCGIRLYVERENERAKRTYLRLGMEETAYRIMEETF